MGLILKYVERTKSERWQYRRRVPKAVAHIIDKREFKRVLGGSEREALMAYPKFHAEVERSIEAAKRQAEGQVAADKDELTERQAYSFAVARAEELLKDNPSAEMRDVMAESLAAAYERDEVTQDPINATAVDRYTINIVRNGVALTKRPDPTLEDAMELYLSDNRSSRSADRFRRFSGQVKLVVRLAQAALGCDPTLTDLTREDARVVRDHMLDQLKSDGERLSPSSVTRYLNSLKAIVNFAVTEMDLPNTFRNPFNDLSVPRQPGSTTAGERRLPLPRQVLQAVRERIIHHARSDLALIWRILAGTGCRLSEVTGLRVEDVDIETDLPHIKIVEHEERSLKNQSSVRQVPLMGETLEAAQEALEAASGEDYLFPHYLGGRGSDTASAALMKHLRTVTSDPRHTVHSLRHNMKDLLLEAEVSKQDQDLILGHAPESVGDRVYGGNVSRLRASTRALKKALGLD